jgi:hypothetical protein
VQQVLQQVLQTVAALPVLLLLRVQGLAVVLGWPLEQQ